MKLVTRCNPQRVVADVCTLEPARAFQEMFGDGARLHQLTRRNAFDVRMVRRLAAIITRRNVDVVHTHAWGTLAEGWLASRLAGARHWIHGEHGTMELGALNVRVQRYLWQSADRLLAVSSQLAGRMAADVRVPRGCIDVIQNGVDTERFGGIPQREARARLRLAEDAFVAVSVGRLVPVKNHTLLLDAAQAMRNFTRRITLLIAGEGPLRQELEQRIVNEGLCGTVRLLGLRDDIPMLLAAADTFVLPSRSEGMSNTILEAMAARLPVIATRVGGNPELVEDGATGLLVAPDTAGELTQALLALATHPAVARDMGALGRRRVERQFSIDRMIARYTALYEQVAGGSPRAPGYAFAE